jgi:transposase
MPLQHRHGYAAGIHHGLPTGDSPSRGVPCPIKHASLDPFRGYANAIRDELPDAVAVLDAFHVVRPGTQVVDEVRRRVQQDTLARRGHKDDPLYKIRGLLHRGREHLSDQQVAKLNACLIAGGPGWEVTLAWHTYQRLRSMYQAETPTEGKQIAENVIGSFHRCPIAEVARIGRTLKMWRDHVLARFQTHRISIGGTEAVNLIIEKTRRLSPMASGHSSTTGYASCSPPPDSGPTDEPPPTPKSEEPLSARPCDADKARGVQRRHTELHLRRRRFVDDARK